MTHSSELTELRPLVFSIAYRMLGSVAEAEDIAQETLLRAHRELRDGTEIESPKAYMTAIATRLSIDHLRSARVRREAYVGPWLPEPLLTATRAPTRASTSPPTPSWPTTSRSRSWWCWSGSRPTSARSSCCARPSTTSSRRSPRSSARARPTAGRSVRGRAATSSPSARASSPRAAAREELAARFLAAAQGDDLDGLIELLAEDAVFTGDGGGKATAFPQPLVGAQRIAHAVRALFRQAARGDGAVTVTPTAVNGQPGWIAHDGDGAVIVVMALDIAGGQVTAIRSIVNPDKLAHLGPVSDRARR